MERRTMLYIAMSLDGYIADSGGGVSWLPEPEGDGGGYEAFAEGIDTVVMGMTTYRQVVEELSPGNWPYFFARTLVFTHSPPPARPGIAFCREDPAAVVRRLKGEAGKSIWICGGAKLAVQLMRADLIDEYQLAVAPVLLGDGVRLFADGRPAQPLELADCRTEDGLVYLTYRRIGKRKEEVQG